MNTIQRNTEEKLEQRKMGGRESSKLFRTERVEGRRRRAYKLSFWSIMAGIIMIWFYRGKQILKAENIHGVEEGGVFGGRWWVWAGLFACEIWFGFYWLITQTVRWNSVHRFPFKEKLSQRCESELPKIDIFVCTADPMAEPPAMVISTILSLMAYNYPTEKLTIYLSDDAGSILTFYALREASIFARHWLPFCRNFEVPLRSPAAVFSKSVKAHSDL